MGNKKYIDTRGYYSRMNYVSNIFNLSLRNQALEFFESLIILVLGWWGINKTSKILLVFLNKSNIDTSIISFLSSCSKFCLRVILIAIVMSKIGFDMTSILAAIGASFIAVGISLKESLSNFVSGIVLVVTKPIHIGDTIEFDGHSGTVMKIEMLFTTLQTQEADKTVIIPNNRLVSNSILRKKSSHNILRYDIQKTLPENISNKDIIKSLQREFLINNKICEFPAPEFEIQSQSELNNKQLHITVWYKEMYSNEIADEMEKIVNKISYKLTQDS